MKYEDAVLVVESIGEYKEIDDVLKNDQAYDEKGFWIFKRKVAKKYDIKDCKFFKKESDMVNKKFKNLNVAIYLEPDKDANVYTIPGYYGKTLEKGILSLVDDDNLVQNYIDLKLSNLNKAKAGPNGTVIFPSNKLKNITIVISIGAIARLTPKERLAIYLHEIGHWVYLANKIPKQILYNPQEFNITVVDQNNNRITYYNIKLLEYAMRLGFSRYNEYDSDLFAHQCGYGDHLSSALENLHKQLDRKYLDAFSFVRQQYIKQFNDKRDSADPAFSTHPSIKRRKDHLAHAKRNKKYSNMT